MITSFGLSSGGPGRTQTILSRKTRDGAPFISIKNNKFKEATMTEEVKKPEETKPEPAKVEKTKEPEAKTRIFVYDGREFSDPDSKKTTDEVRLYFAALSFPELANAQILAAVVRPSKTPGTQEQVIEFKRRVGDKG
jgi:PRTRC genetic system protein C